MNLYGKLQFYGENYGDWMEILALFSMGGGDGDGDGDGGSFIGFFYVKIYVDLILFVIFN